MVARETSAEPALIELWRWLHRTFPPPKYCTILTSDCRRFPSYFVQPQPQDRRVQLLVSRAPWDLGRLPFQRFAYEQLNSYNAPSGTEEHASEYAHAVLDPAARLQCEVIFQAKQPPAPPRWGLRRVSRRYFCPCQAARIGHSVVEASRHDLQISAATPCAAARWVEFS